MAKLYDLARMTTATTSTGAITLGAAVSGFLTFAQAGVSDGDVVSYGISDGLNSECGTGTYTAAGTLLTRTVSKSTNSNAAISLSGTAEVFIAIRAEDVPYAGPTFSGRLTVTSTTALNFGPWNGDTIRIAGMVLQIPSAGITGGANTGVFVNGAGASNLAASTLYYVYAFVNSGTITFDFRTDGNGHLPDNTAGNGGTEVRVSAGTTRDSTRTLIGMIYTDASSHFIDGQTASWFNQRPKSAGSTSSTTGTSTADIFVTWANSSITLSTSGVLNNTSTQAQSAQLLLDGAVVGASGTGNTISGQINNYPYGLIYMSMAQTEGNHSVATHAIANAGTTTLTYGQYATFSG